MLRVKKEIPKKNRHANTQGSTIFSRAYSFRDIISSSPTQSNIMNTKKKSLDEII